jgi:transketolase
MANLDLAKLEAIARDGRVQILRMLTHAGSGHPGGSLSVIDILTVLYFSRMKYDPKKPTWEDRDRFVLSKGHCVPAQYYCMARAGFFPESLLLTLRKLGSPLQGHPDRMALPGSPRAWRSGSSWPARARACTACWATGKARRDRSGKA